jgi:hypothetical protein
VIKSLFIRRAALLFAAIALLTALLITLTLAGLTEGTTLHALVVALFLVPFALPFAIGSAIAEGLLVAILFQAFATQWPRLPRASILKRAFFGAVFGVLVYIATSALFGGFWNDLRFVLQNTLPTNGISSAVIALWGLQSSELRFIGIPIIVGCLAVSLTLFKGLSRAAEA